MIEIFKEDSVIRPGTTQVVIFGPTAEDVERELFIMTEYYGEVDFSLPKECPDGRWTITGHVS